eukprot:TRINITY_DN11588_c0_g1_i1.p1 TRINITY_DN11588_c0_g1~~TRINITY_DN11588_c0_g1_i1.p1  ORF type:complete len:555 (+),score=46.76 TRINITY_DN11588_c0_g1_i1:2254-3918(+)
MAERACPWRRICPEAIKAKIETAQSIRLLCLAQSGPTGFIVKEPESRKKHKVLLGGRSKCNCNDFQKHQDLCVHILWVCLKRLRVASSNPLLWQQALVDREVDEIMRSAHSIEAATVPSQVGKDGGSTGNAEDVVEPRPIEPDDVCPICQCELLDDDDPCLHCQHGCGRHVHKSCMLEYAKHAQSQGEQSAKCPLCRVDFGTLEDIRHRGAKTTRRDVRGARTALHRGTSCAGCKQAPIQQHLYCCATCQSYHLCQECFNAGTHPDHSFNLYERPGAAPKAVSRQALPTALIANLQDRELTDQDYDMLLLLDQQTNAAALPTTNDLNKHLPAILLHAQHPVARANDIVCSICQHPMTTGQRVRRLHCKHLFHTACIDPYLTTQRNACPIDGQVPFADSTSGHSQNIRPRRERTKPARGRLRRGARPKQRKSPELTLVVGNTNGSSLNSAINTSHGRRPSTAQTRNTRHKSHVATRPITQSLPELHVQGTTSHQRHSNSATVAASGSRRSRRSLQPAARSRPYKPSALSNRHATTDQRLSTFTLPVLHGHRLAPL